MNSALANCEHCGVALPRDAPEGLCPRCVLRTVSGLAIDEMAAATTLTRSVQTPNRFGDYELIEPIAQGGMGVVSKARQVSLNRIVAVKMLPFGAFTREDLVQRFRAEAEAAAKLQHPNIISIHEVGTHEGCHYFSMEFVDGPNLAEVVREQPMPLARVTRLVRTLAEAVHYAHERGILHRDLKPSNVLLDPLDQPRITDFGLAKDLHRNAELTLSGQALGSPGYLPPEQAEGRHADITARSDVYSLGAILYHLLTGRPPFVGETATTVLQQVVNADPVAPRLLNPAVPRDLETICLKCLEKEPGKRYSTATELGQELARVQNDEPITARPIGISERVWRWCRRRPAIASLLGLALLLLLGGLSATSWQWRRAEQHSRALSATVARLKIDQAEERLNGREAGEGLALLASLLRENPANRVAAQRIVSILTQRNFLRPLPGAAELWHSRWTSGFAQHEHLLVTTTNHGRTLVLWDTAAGWQLKRTIEVGEPVRHSVFSRDGRWLLVATHEKSLRLYDVTDGSLCAGPYRIEGFTDQLLLSPDGAHAVVIAGADDTLSSWRTIRGSVFRLSDGLKVHRALVFHWAAFSPDGRFVITVNNGTAQVRDAMTWAPVGKPIVVPERINAAEFSANSSQIVTAGADFNVSVWETSSGQRLFKLAHPVNVQNAFFTPDGKRIFTRDNASHGRLWDAATGKMLGEAFPHQKGHGPTSFSPDGRSLLSYSRSAMVLRDVETSLPRAEPIVTGEVPTRARFLPDARRLVLTTMDGTVRFWNVRPTGMSPMIFPEKLELSDGSLSPDGKKIALVLKSNWGRVWSAETGELAVPFFRHDMPGEIKTVRWSGDSRFFVTAAIDGTALIRDVLTGRSIGEPLRHKAALTHAEFSPDGRWVATASEDHTARIWNATNCQAVSPPLKHDQNVRRARFSRDGKRLLTASHDRTVRLWSVPDGRELSAPITNQLDVHEAVFNRDGTRIATAGSGSYASVWDINSRQELTRLKHAGALTTVRFDSNGTRVVTGSQDGTARVWDALNGQPLSRPLRHRGDVTVAEFSPDGRFVLTASVDGTARIWDAASGHAVSDPFEHKERIVAAEWARDGRSFLTVSYDRSAKLWPVFLVPEGAAPPWLVELAEASGLLTMEGDHMFRPAPLERVATVFDSMREARGNDAWSQWLQAFLAPREPRPVPELPAVP